MNHQLHRADEIKGKVWFFPTEKSHRAAYKNLLNNQNLIKELQNGCYHFSHGSVYHKKAVDVRYKLLWVIIFVYCPTVRQEKIDEVVRRIESHKGEELKTKEARTLIKTVRSRLLKINRGGDNIKKAAFKKWN